MRANPEQGAEISHKFHVPMADAPVMATYGVEASTKRRSSSPEAKSPLSSG
ncbi:MAG: hypothetical protein JRM88_06820 [Nitrososphaerota archaeon]|nr:hypothetical protein [Nitrososphaerota archaeon]